jgi:hypothetical protein
LAVTVIKIVADNAVASMAVAAAIDCDLHVRHSLKILWLPVFELLSL